MLPVTITLHVSWLCRESYNTLWCPRRICNLHTQTIDHKEPQLEVLLMQIHLHTRQYSNCRRQILLKMPLVVRQHCLFNGHTDRVKRSEAIWMKYIESQCLYQTNINNFIKVSVYIMQCKWQTRAFRSDLCFNTGIINTRAKTGLQTISKKNQKLISPFKMCFQNTNIPFLKYQLHYVHSCF